MSDCWYWTAAAGKEGYGRIGVRIAANVWRARLAHRIVYEMYRGRIPKGLTLDHLCRVRLCVNPEHLEPVSIRENCKRGFNPSWQTHNTKVCKRGHALIGDAVRVRTDRPGQVQCRTCDMLRNKLRRERVSVA